MMLVKFPVLVEISMPAVLFTPGCHSASLQLCNRPSVFEQVLLTLHADIFDRIPFFCGRHPQFLAEIMPHLQLEYYTASEYVMWEGDQGTEMYFVSEGILEVRVRVFTKSNSGALHFMGTESNNFLSFSRSKCLYVS